MQCERLSFLFENLRLQLSTKHWNYKKMLRQNRKKILFIKCIPWVFFLPGLQSRNHVFQICVNPKDGGMEDVCGMFHKHTDDECYSDLQN